MDHKRIFFINRRPWIDFETRFCFTSSESFTSNNIRSLRKLLLSSNNKFEKRRNGAKNRREELCRQEKRNQFGGWNMTAIASPHSYVHFKYQTLCISRLESNKRKHFSNSSIENENPVIEAFNWHRSGHVGFTSTVAVAKSIVIHQLKTVLTFNWIPKRAFYVVGVYWLECFGCGKNENSSRRLTVDYLSWSFNFHRQLMESQLLRGRLDGWAIVKLVLKAFATSNFAGSLGAMG